MDQPTLAPESSTSVKFAIGFGIIGVSFIALLIFCCWKTRSKDSETRRRRSSSRSSIESFQQLFFSQTPFEQIKTLEQRVIERWSSVNQPSMTFYRVHMEDNSDNLYQPVNEERVRSSFEQSKAMEYAGLEIIFF